MQGDFTRHTFKSGKRYSSVRMQQGRVQLDADWNEQIDIQDHRERTAAMDVIGASGAPMTGGGFLVGVSGDKKSYTVSPGRIYVDGILCESDAPAGVPVPFLTADRTDLVYLEVWERHISAVEDPEIRETALGGPDTATRTQVVARVRVKEDVGDIACKGPIPGFPPPASGGLLTVEFEPEPPSGGPCKPTPEGGYRGLENQFYRIEIHTGGALGSATFKWSRDNASLVTGIGEFVSSNQVQVRSLGRDPVMSFRKDDWVEILDDATELALQPGTLAQITDVNTATLIVTLSKPVSGFDINGRPRMRRWDQPSDAIPATAGPIAIEQGIQVRFSGSNFQPGDYWNFAARATTGEIETLTNAQPRGILRHCAPLALVAWAKAGDNTFTAKPTDCRAEFPPLTGICAEDVCFENTTCGFPGAMTVQDALDQLCRARDLRFHNKHLHGWGIVCGLKVVCGSDREKVGVRSGYAIDCEGHDIEIAEPDTVELLERIRKHDKENPNAPLLVNGTGDVCLTLSLDDKRKPAYGIVKHDPKKDAWRELLAGTLLMDFYENCIGNIADFLREELKPSPGEADAPAGPVQQRVAALMNLAAQLANPKAGQRIFVSPREHKILLDFYNGLQKVLASETFCAQFDDARPFPQYPFGDLGLDTMFGRGRHVRLRMRPDGRELYSVGPGINPLKPKTTVNRYDLEKNRLIAQIDPLSGVQNDGSQADSGAGAVQDVAFSADSNLIYVIATTRNEENSFFRVGQITAAGINWRPVVTICGVRLLTLAVTAADRNNVYAVGRKKSGGGGLYQINPDAVDPNMKPLKEFIPAGHLKIAPDGRAFATAAAAGGDPNTYFSIKRFRLPAGVEDPEIKLEAGGRDDLAIEPERGLIFTVIDAKAKQIAVYGMEDARLRASVPAPQSTLRLEPYTPTGMLMVSIEDAYALTLVDMSKPQPAQGYLLPLQVSPIALAAHAARRRAFALNQASDTVSTIQGDLLKPEFRFDFKTLAEYRKGVLEAYMDLFGHFAQYLKDCFCDRFLVECPECEEADRLYLACISVRDNKVKKVCNFSRRKYVKSFPTVSYWLSVVPVMPVLKALFERLCCLILPDLFGRYKAPEYQEETTPPMANLKFSTVRESAVKVQAADVPSRTRKVVKQAAVAGNLVMDAVRSRAAETFTPSAAAAAGAAVVGQPIDKAEANLKAGGVQVKRAAYDPATAKDLPSGVAGIFRAPAPGSEVTLYEENGVVRYYAVAPKAVSGEVRAEVAQLAESVRAQEEQLQSRVAALSEAVGSREVEIARLNTDLQAAQTRIATVPALQDQVATLAEAVRAREAEIARLNTDLQAAQTRLAMIPALQGQVASLNDQLKARETDLQAVKTDLGSLRQSHDEALASRDREISGVKEQLQNVVRRLPPR